MNKQQQQQNSMKAPPAIISDIINSWQSWTFT